MRFCAARNMFPSFRKRERLVILLVAVALLLLLGGLKYYFGKIFIPPLDPVELRPADVEAINEMNKGQRCKIPMLNPYHPEILPYLQYPVMEKCTMKKYGVVKGKYFYLELKNVIEADLFYIRRVDDFEIALSDKVSLLDYVDGSQIVYPLEEEFFKVMMTRAYEWHVEYHVVVLKKEKDEKETKVDMEKQLNVMMIMFDSVSHAHAQRAFRKTYRYLEDHPRGVIFKGQSIVGDGTTAQLCAMLIGTPEKDLPEVRKGFKDSVTVDKWPFIFKDLHQRNYKTVYSEEDHSGSTFQLRLKGFDNPPTTHYLRPFWLALNDFIYADEAVSCPHQINFDYLNHFFDTYQDSNKFAVVVNTLTHNKVYLLENADEDTFQFYQRFSNSNYSKNTVIILFGDHGLRASSFRGTLQGKMEERLPFMSILLPPSFDQYIEEMQNLKRNSYLMTSHFDIYATLQHLLAFPRLNEKARSNKFGKSLFTDIRKLNRTCDQAGVDSHWCTCLSYKQVNTAEDRNVEILANKIIQYMNHLNSKQTVGKCATLTLQKVTRAARRVPNADVYQFVGTKTEKGGCDACGVKYDRKKPILHYQYEINFIVSPSGGVYEANGDIIHKEGGGMDVTHSKDISRTNLYGKQPHCIAKSHPHLRKYCFCV